MRRWHALAIALTLAACGDSGPDDFDNQEFVGTWQLSIPAKPECWPVAFVIQFDVTQENAGATGPADDRVQLSSVWMLADDPSTVQGAATGVFDWGRNEFQLSFGVQTGSHFEFDGTGVSPQAVTGTYSEPPDIAFQDGCSVRATARHV